MYTANVKVVRHQRSFAKFPYACPIQALLTKFITSGWKVQPTVQFHWSKIPVFLAVYQTLHMFISDVILFLQTLSNFPSLSSSKGEDSVTLTSGVSMSYSSSTDDSSSLGTPSGVPQASTEAPESDSCQEKPTSPGVSGETEEEEKKDRLTEVPERSAILRTSIRSLSPFRRHSWGPGKNSAGETEISQRRYESPLLKIRVLCLKHIAYFGFTHTRTVHVMYQFVLDQFVRKVATLERHYKNISVITFEEKQRRNCTWINISSAHVLSDYVCSRYHMEYTLKGFAFVCTLHQVFVSKLKSLDMQTAIFCPLETGHWGYYVLKGLYFSFTSQSSVVQIQRILSPLNPSRQPFVIKNIAQYLLLDQKIILDCPFWNGS